MVRSAFAVLTLTLAPFASLRGQERDLPPTCTVLRIIDGDTFECRIGGIKQSVRLLGIDTPEPGQRPHGAKATAALKRLLRLKSKVMLELDVRERDSRGRLLAYVWRPRDGMMVNLELVEQGFALVLVEPPNVLHADTLRAAARTAQRLRRGLWATSAFECTPVDFRMKKCT
jgi:micrococcal nuclease